MTSIDGEYRLLGHLGSETVNVYNEYGSGPAQTVNILAGGRQDFEFVDGLRFSIMPTQNMSMNVDFFTPVTPDQVPNGMKSLCKNSFSQTILTWQRNLLLSRFFRLYHQHDYGVQSQSCSFHATAISKRHSVYATWARWNSTSNQRSERSPIIYLRTCSIFHAGRVSNSVQWANRRQWRHFRW